MKRIALVCLLAIFTGIVHAQTQSDLIGLADMLKIKTAGNIVVNKQGTKAAFTVTSIEPDEKQKLDYKYLTQLFLADLTSTLPPVQITYAKESSTAPAWSPDGEQLAFVRTVEGKPQIFVMPLRGGEAFQLTRLAAGAGNPKWSPNGKNILFSSSISYKELLKDSVLNPQKAFPFWPTEKPGIALRDLQMVRDAKPNVDGGLNELRAWLMTNEMDGKATVLNKLNFQDESNISANMNFNQFYLTEVKPLADAKPIIKGFARFNNVDFTPDGKNFLITADIDSLEHPDRSLESEIFLANVDGTNFKLLAGAKGMNYNSARLSPSGKWLAYFFDKIDGDVPALAVMPLGGNINNAVIIPFDRNKSNLTWSDDEKWLYFTAQSNGGSPLYRANISSKKIEQLTDYAAGISSFGLTKNGIIYTKTTAQNPSEVFLADASFKTDKQVSALNEWIKTKRLSLPQKKTFVNKKGVSIEYWVMKPTNFQDDKKHPLLVEIHGGPTAMWGPGEASMWHEFQYFAARGYGVVYSNPSGSGGYGAKFIRSNVGDWGAGPAADVLSALDNTVAEGWADTGKLFITGGSYAGYLTAWIIAHDKRFKAACAQRGVYDLATFFGEGNAWRLVPRYFGGYPWQQNVKELLVRESPINYVQNITTPLIIFHGDNDRRTGFVQSEMLYRSLKVLGRPVEYVRHPGATHELTRSGDNRQRMDQLGRTYEFFQRWLN